MFFTRISILSVLAAIIAHTVVVVRGELIVLEEDQRYCIAAKKIAARSKLKIFKCDSKSDKQIWKVEKSSLGVLWRLVADESLCVEASQLLQKKRKPRLSTCRHNKKQRWTPHYGESEKEITSDKNSNLCIAYSGAFPKSGRNVKLHTCSGQTKQGWLWLDEGKYEKEDANSPQQESSARTYYISPPGDPIPYVQLRTIDASIIDGYSAVSGGCTALYEDIYNSTLIFANERIKANADAFRHWGNNDDKIRWRPEWPILAPGGEMDVVAAAPTPAAAPGAANQEDSYETNTQEADVDEADILKSDGNNVFAAYGDILVVWDATTGAEKSRTKMPPKMKLSYEDGGYGDNDGSGVPYPGPYPLPLEGVSKIAEEAPAAKNGDNGRQRLRGRRDSIWIPPNPKPRISGLLLDKNSSRLAVIVSGYRYEYRYDYLDRPILTDKGETHVRLYETSDIPADGSELPFISSREMWGSFRSARMIGGMAHVVVQSGIDWWQHVTRRLDPWQTLYDGLNRTEYIEAAVSEAKVAADRFAKRLVKELSLVAGATKECSGVTRVALFASGGENDNDVDGWPGMITSQGIFNSYLQVSTFDMRANPLLESTLLEMKTAGSFFPSSWSEIYASKDVLVASGRGYNHRPFSRSWDEFTHFLSFKLNSDGTAPSGLAIGRAQGYLINQFAMDEYQGYFRVATTTNAQWGCLDNPERVDDEEAATTEPCKWGRISNSTSQLTMMKMPDISDGGTVREMKTIKVLDKLGITEVIMSARFMDSKAYIVTFMRTDPVYTIDFSDPANPFVAHELKIPGFSTYMHPIGKDRLLTIGRDADEQTGMVTGFQVTLFDVADLKNTSVLQRHTIQDRWASSVAEGDQMAFRYLPDSKLLLLPLTIHGYKDRSPFDGFQVYYVDDYGISPRFKVSMVSDPQMISRGCWYDAYLPARSMVFKGNATFVKGHGYVSYDLNTETKRWAHNLDKDVEDQCFYYWR